MARPAIAKGAVEIAKKKGLDVVVHEMFPGGTTDFSVILNKVKAARPEALVVGAPPADAIAISRPVRELDVNVKLYGVTPGAAYPDFQKALGKTADFVYAVPTGSPVSRTPVIRSSSPRTRKSSVARPPRTRPGPTRVANSSSTPSGGQEPWTRTPSVEHC
jgi:ABC-type branched-subunit amino acid transport system substrate-binding protein